MASRSEFAAGGAPPVLQVRGAREHNLRNIDLDLPLGQLVVLTGVSGSGKSSLAVGVIAAAGQRRILENLPLIRGLRFQKFDPPEVDTIDAVPAPLLIRYDHAELATRRTQSVLGLLQLEGAVASLFQWLGQPICPVCRNPVQPDSPAAVLNWLRFMPDGIRVQLTFPVGDVQRGSGPRSWITQGYRRAIVGERTVELETLARWPRGAVQIVADRLVTGPGRDERWQESLALAFREGGGECSLFWEQGRFPSDDATRAPLCLLDGHTCVRRDLSTRPRCSLCSTPVVLPSSEALRRSLAACETVAVQVVPQAEAEPKLRSYLLADLTPAELQERCLKDWRDWLRRLPTRDDRFPVANVLESLRLKIETVVSLGLGHITASRPVDTLSSGEARRLDVAGVATQDLPGALLILEEPAAGLHPSEVGPLVELLRGCQTRQQSLLVVEHDPLVTARADRVVELGPGAGSAGGQVVAQGTPAELARIPTSVTATTWQSWRQRHTPRVIPAAREWIRLHGVTGRHFQGIDLHIPVGRLTVVTGVSGSGKTSLIMEGLAGAVSGQQGSGHVCVSGLELPYSMAVTPIEATRLTAAKRSMVATWLQVFEPIRQIFAETPIARQRGWTSAQFSLFSKQGLACPVCRGLGRQTIELDVLSDATLTCPECQGTRYRPAVLDARYRGLSIVDVLQMSIREAATLFRTHGGLQQRLAGLVALELGYLQLGHPARDVSLGEAQRIRLASQLWASSPQPRLILCDEPSTGLHSRDVEPLAVCCRQLADLGQSVVLIDHQKRLLEEADWIVELGPGGGPQGCRIVHQGTPRDVMSSPSSLAGVVLRGEVFDAYCPQVSPGQSSVSTLTSAPAASSGAE